MKNKLFTTFALALFVGGLAACSSAPSAPPGSATSAARISTVPVGSASPTPAAAQPTLGGTAAPAQPSAAATSASKASPTQARASVPFPSSAGLDKLDSYDMTLRVSFKGTRNGQAVDATDFYTRSFSLNPAAQFTTIQTTGDDGKPDTIVQGLVGDVQYMRIGRDDACRGGKIAATEPHIFNPVLLLKPILQGKEAGSETVNGLPTRHYIMETLKNSDTEMSGEVWIADKNAFVVKYALIIKGGEQYFGKGNKGEQTLAFELRDVGAKKTVAVPKGCLPPITDLPAMPDAANVTRSLTELSYTTASDVAKTMGFYQEQMKALGWTMVASPLMSAESDDSGSPIANLPVVIPPGAAQAMQNSWLVFRLASEQRRVHITIQPEGSSLKVIAEIVQE